MATKIFDDQLIVVTGAAGFIGSGVVRHLNDKGLTNLLLVDDIGESEKWKNLVGKQFYDFISIRELESWLQGRERDIEAFIHLGACSDTTEPNGDYLMENNYRFTIDLAEYALNHGHRFIYASSAATYGDGSLGFSDDHAMLEELRPLNLYGFSKHLFDLWAKRQGVLNKLVGLKYFNVYGPNETHKGRMASMVYKMAPVVKDQGIVKLFQSSEPEKFGDGEQQRDFIYVKDAARITCDFLENDVGGIFNVGYGEPVTWNRMASALFSALDKEKKIEYIPMPKDLIGKYQNYTCANMAKYQKHFKDHQLHYSVEDGVKDYMQNHWQKGARW